MFRVSGRNDTRGAGRICHACNCCRQYVRCSRLLRKNDRVAFFAWHRERGRTLIQLNGASVSGAPNR